MIWREKRVLLGILGILLAANVVFFFTYRVQYQSRLDELDARLAEVERDLETTRASRATAEQSFRSFRQVEADVAEVFNEHWSTQPERLAALITEVKRLADASNLIPASYSFARGETKRVTSSGGRKRELGANEVSITFSVQGSYAQARRLINLLELSRQFVIIESIALTAGEGNLLTLNLQLKTLFRDEQPGAASNQT
jgi:Tfp pilus assembly protein PilO